MITYAIYAYLPDSTESLELEGITSRLRAIIKKEELEKKGYKVTISKKAWKQATPDIIRLFDEVLSIQKRIKQDYYYTKLDSLALKIIDAKHCLDNLDFDKLEQKSMINLTLGNIILYNNCVCLTGGLANINDYFNTDN